uniref:TauD/TfdA-like domain-containing protein n=1 Tax=Chromera velia CCMP2878 TaxID=1169474 RepID=A0A0G4I0J6_9ALVE|eukprot:Cvel_34391.t1-p1 / transcript=Cvel_34391.t1 / gene=Cvel_34391 / organism=Chromera_velia_CCMP2878 / gene_product=hypothetical protein / transcript_product=hypothetical protein / location=Cvel_scaffold5890:63-2906(-) / protein_length=862 / sequence_SO=supercontig / SO=protein_coding / is_pseudo=false
MSSSSDSSATALACGMQVLPSDFSSLTAEGKLSDHRQSMGDALRPTGLFEVIPEEAVSPYPFGLGVSTTKVLRQNVEVLGEALEKVVALYWQDSTVSSSPSNSGAQKRLRETVPIPAKIERVLRETANKRQGKFELGSWRPDFLLSSDGRPLICEINARFSFNGYFLTALMSRAHSEMKHLEGSPGLPPRQHASVEEVFASFFDPQEPVVVMIGKEKGWDVHLFEKAMERRGRAVRFASPDELFVNGEGALCDSRGPIRQAALELHQWELLGLSEEVLHAIATLPRCLNDLRTVFLVHDKRLLSALYDLSLMESLVGRAKAERLRNAVVPSYTLNLCDATAIAEAEANRAGWVIKSPLLGKGAKMLFGRSCSAEEWIERLREGRMGGGDVLQPRIEQAIFPIVSPLGGEMKEREMHVVGLMLCFGRRCLGFGIWRGSPLEVDVVNFSGGKGVLLLPVLLPSPWALEAPCAAGRRAGEVMGRRVVSLPRGVWESVSEGAVGGMEEEEETAAESVRVCVEKNGICVVDCREWLAAAVRDGDAEDEEVISDRVNSQLVRFLRRLGPLNLHNADESSAVWDVRPKQTGKEGKREEQGSPARSKTAKEFPMHTDCCFEDSPPRYIALLVMRPDQNGGGLSSLISGEALRQHLSRRTLDTLHNTKFKFRVSPEFGKETERDWVEGRVLSSNGLWRYRSEVIIRDECSEEQLEALDELDASLCNPALTVNLMMPKGAMVVLDNAAWFHARSSVKDSERWLKRVRFHHPDDETALTEFTRRFRRGDSLYRQIRVRTIPSQRFCMDLAGAVGAFGSASIDMERHLKGLLLRGAGEVVDGLTLCGTSVAFAKDGGDRQSLGGSMGLQLLQFD